MAKKTEVLGVHAPPPRPTPWAAGLLAAVLSAVFLIGLGLLRLVT